MKRLNCNACGGHQTMGPAKVSKMSGVVQVIGWLFVAPSALGVALAALMMLASVMATGEVAADAVTEAERAGAGLGLMAAGGMSACVGVSSLISGLIGYLLIMKKKVWKCHTCGFHMDRD